MEKIINFNQFGEMIAQQLGVDQGLIMPETSLLDDLGIDSLSLVNVIIKLERKYNIRIEMDTVWKIKNIGEAYDIFIQKVTSAHQDPKGYPVRSRE